MLLVVMGVTGSGKTTVGEALAARLRVPFRDADDFHSAANIAKMSAGTPLTDADRLPWLRAIGTWLAEHRDTGAVATSSALRRHYRDVLREQAPDAFFVHLDGDPTTARVRVAGRTDHFMPVSLVDSQYATLEPLGADERGVVLDMTEPVDDLVDRAVRTSSPDR
ncbi:gluconokinase [Actinophytocola sediminis]